MISGRALSDPDGTQPLVAAVRWIEQALLGTTATIVATIAVAAIGLLMMSGRIPLRRGMGVVAGCFILFGAVAIAQGIMGLVNATEADSRADVPDVVAQVPPPAVAPPPQPQVYDPYAGASVPIR